MTRNDSLADETALAAHDLRGALTVVTGYVDLLRRPDLTDADRARAFTGMDAALRRAGALLDSLAGVAGPQTPSELVELAPLVERAAEDAHAASGRSVLVGIHGAPAVRGDAVSLSRALQNLLDNAARYAPEGDIEVTVGTSPGTAVIEVADRGPGISPEERTRVLEPRARLVRDEATPGSGLGLTVVRGAVESHEGRLELLPREGGGLVARIELPLT